MNRAAHEVIIHPQTGSAGLEMTTSNCADSRIIKICTGHALIFTFQAQIVLQNRNVKCSVETEKSSGYSIKISKLQVQARIFTFLFRKELVLPFFPGPYCAVLCIGPPCKILEKYIEVHKMKTRVPISAFCC